MKSLLTMVGLFIACSALAQTQVPHDFEAGQAARAAHINENFDALESAIDALSTTSATHAGIVDGLAHQLSNLERAIKDLGGAYGVCSARNVSACRSLLGGQDLHLEDLLLNFGVLLVASPQSLNFHFAIIWERTIGIEPSDDRIKLAFGRQANFTRGGSIGEAEVLVDSCTDPSIYLVPVGANKTGGLGVNGGKVYVGDYEAEPVTIDVTGGTYGLIHDWTKGFPSWDRMGPPPLCTLVNDREGFYDSYPLILHEDTGTWGQEWSLSTQDLLNQ